MRRIILDYVTPPGRPFFAWIILVAGAVVLGLAADGYADRVDEVQLLETQLTRLKRQTSAPQTAKGRSQVAAKERSEQRERELLAKASGVSWASPLTAIETALDRDVALIALNQEFSARRIKLGLEAKSIADALAFADRLRATGKFDDVVLTGHETKKSSGVEALGLTFVLVWKATT
ncbi:hypothetical protein [Dechloromonas sp. HYN0024]|uniref:hypothetical protein n=1 Tax=Dechloromonas sp. HYN0024 TaxID=2231055 RepID=UPI000E438E14|nr:hypothetical protein [Dechloromonas sp. HYN0024]AXS80143.1 hypothetical protein HYN24_08990 [Dechloromonas sp. HYN0024]